RELLQPQHLISCAACQPVGGGAADAASPTTMYSKDSNARVVAMAIVLVRRHRPLVVYPPGTLVGRQLAEGAGHRAHVRGHGAAARTPPRHGRRRSAARSRTTWSPSRAGRSLWRTPGRSGLRRAR